MGPENFLLKELIIGKILLKVNHLLLQLCGGKKHQFNGLFFFGGLEMNELLGKPMVLIQ